MHIKLLKVYLRFLLALLLCWPLLSTAAPEVVVSIKPVHSLIAGVMAGVGSPLLLSRNGQTPHNISLVPSDVRKLSRADRVFWIGESLESPLAKILQAMVDESKAVELHSMPAIELLPLREGGVWEAHANDENSGVQSEHDTAIRHDGHKATPKQNANPHIWLSPVNATHIVRLVIEDLSGIDPENAVNYQRNGKAVLARISAMDLEIRKRLSGVTNVPYIVFHDAYAYFEYHYGLNAVGSVTVSPERMPGARRIQQLRDKIIALKARCVFSEPQFEPRLVHTLLEGTEARSGHLDPLGSSLPAGPDAYFLMMNNLAQSLADCLGKDKQGGLAR